MMTLVQNACSTNSEKPFAYRPALYEVMLVPLCQGPGAIETVPRSSQQIFCRFASVWRATYNRPVRGQAWEQP